MTIAESSMSGLNSLANSKYQPEGSVFGRFTDQSPLRRTSFERSQSAARRRESPVDTPASASAYMAIAVSQIGEKQGWQKKPLPSFTINASHLRTASTRCG